jgi:hypothetical protein
MVGTGGVRGFESLISLLEFLGVFTRSRLYRPSRRAPLLSLLGVCIPAALIVRVLSTWLPVSPYSKWIRWSYVLTDWLINPLRRLIPLLDDRHHADRRVVPDRIDPKTARDSVMACA